jgi:hypothetical protein
MKTICENNKILKASCKILGLKYVEMNEGSRGKLTKKVSELIWSKTYTPKTSLLLWSSFVCNP